MRVAFVLAQNGLGGTEAQARALITQLLQRNITVHVFLLDGSTGVAGLPVSTEVLMPRRTRGPLAPIRYIRAARSLRSRLRGQEFDVVHGAMARGYVVAGLACMGLAGPLRVAWRRNMGVHLTSRWWPFRWLERRMIAHTDVVIVNSDDVRDYWLTLSGAPPGKFRVIPNIIEPWRFEAVAPRLQPTDRFRLVCVGALKPGKGHDTLLRAVAQLPELACEVLVVGEGALRGDLERLAADLRVDAQFVGAVADPRPWLASADIYVHPSVSEGSSNAVLEAMAQGLPVVATAVGGMRQLVGDTALLVDSNSPRDLAASIRWMAGHPAGAADLGRRARSRALARADVNRIVDDYLGVYGMKASCAG